MHPGVAVTVGEYSTILIKEMQLTLSTKIMIVWAKVTSFSGNEAGKRKAVVA